MLHLENFFEKSFALLLTTPILFQQIKKTLKLYAVSSILILYDARAEICPGQNTP